MDEIIRQKVKKKRMGNNKASVPLASLLRLTGFAILLLSFLSAGSYLAIKSAKTLVTVLNTQQTVNIQPEGKKKKIVDTEADTLPELLVEYINPTKPKTIDLTDKKSTIILLYGAIMDNGNEIAALIRTAAKSKKPIYLLIDSPGGSVISGGAIVSAIEASPVPVYTVCLQVCASMAAMLHQYGARRYMVDRSILMFHNASGGFQGSLPQVASLFKTINRFVNKMFHNTAKRSGQEISVFLAKIQNDLWIDAEDSLEQHYSDETVNVVYEDKDALNPPSFLILEERIEFKRAMNLMDVK